ncbi:MAG: cation diffusion facilitator family transporter [Bacteroidetes bacterium]|nr:cation diffusion facilitator family transporter [Bacteroidota bacterium]
MQIKVERASRFSLISNIFLFLIKLAAGVLSNSIAVISDAINSFTDILTTYAVHFSVKVSYKQADHDHQYGHHAAQPIAAMILAIFAGVAGITVIRESISRIIHPSILDIITFPLIVLALTIFLKSFMAFYFSQVSRKYDSPAIRALGVDSFNDVLSSFIALVGIIISSFGFKYFDGIAGILIAFFIFRSGYHIAKENIDYLMGKAASKELLIEITNRALKIPGVVGMNDLKSHYIGNKYHIEIHIEVDRNSTTKMSHDIGKEVEKVIEELPLVAEVFVHIDPV